MASVLILKQKFVKPSARILRKSYASLKLSFIIERLSLPVKTSMQNRQFIHEYLGFGGAPSSCHFSFFETVTGLALCIADELPHNTGTPIGEFAEHLATHAYRELHAPSGTHVEEFLYVGQAASEDASGGEYSYALVDFDWDEEVAARINSTPGDALEIPATQTLSPADLSS